MKGMSDLRRTAVRNLALLHREATPAAVREEIERIECADRLAGCLLDLTRPCGCQA